MENRFTFKDLVMFLSLGVLIALVVLAMVQFDRQYDQVLTVKSQNDQLASEVARIKRQLSDLAANGVAMAGPNRARTAAEPEPVGSDAFTHLLAAEEQEDFARGGWFIDNFGTKIGKLTPFLAQDVYAYWVQAQVLESFVDRDPYTLAYVPRIARSWEISPDGLTMRFYLRDDVTFSDGHPLTADDVIFTYEWIRNPEVNASRDRAYLTSLAEIRKIDDYTVEFTFTDQYFKNFEVAGAQAILPKHFYARFSPSEFNDSVGLLMGSGPYALENPETWAPGNGVTLVRNPRYWGVPGTFDRIVFNEIEEESAEQVRYGNQEHDIIRCRASPELYLKLTNDERIMSFSQNFRVSSPYSGYLYIGWNQQGTIDGQPHETWFADTRVRQAMTMLIDRERLCQEIFLGYSTVATGPFAPTGQQVDPNVEPWPYDPERAKRLLAEAGYQDRNGDGIVEGSDGKPFRFTLSYPGGSEMYERLVLFLRDNLAQGGVVLEPERLDWPVLLNRLTQSDFSAVILGWSSTPETDPYQVFHSSQIDDQGDNRTHYVNRVLDTAIEQARTTIDVQDRMQHWHRVHQILHEDQPYTFLTNRDELYLINKRIHNVEQSNVGLNFEYLNGGMIPWYIPKTQQQMTR